ASCSLAAFDALAATAAGGQLLHPLISLPRSEPAAQLFQRGLLACQLKWEPSMEISELDLILQYVAKGFGFGLAVDIPGSAWPENVRKIRLPPDFPQLGLGALHIGETELGEVG